MTKHVSSILPPWKLGFGLVRRGEVERRRRRRAGLCVGGLLPFERNDDRAGRRGLPQCLPLSLSSYGEGVCHPWHGEKKAYEKHWHGIVAGHGSWQAGQTLSTGWHGQALKPSSPKSICLSLLWKTFFHLFLKLFGMTWKRKTCGEADIWPCDLPNLCSSDASVSFHVKTFDMFYRTGTLQQTYSRALVSSTKRKAKTWRRKTERAGRKSKTLSQHMASHIAGAPLMWCGLLQQQQQLNFWHLWTDMPSFSSVSQWTCLHCGSAASDRFAS